MRQITLEMANNDSVAPEMLALSWNNLHVLSREYICWHAAVNLSIAQHSWEDIDDWLKYILKDTLERITK